VGRSGFNLFSITLEIILYTTMHIIIGLYRSGVLASFYLGIGVIIVAFSAFKMEADLLDSSTTL
jgi:hypothetical protein